jgi:hypothetical protein
MTWHAYTVRPCNEAGDIYVSFPYNGITSKISNDMKNWLTENTMGEWGMVNGSVIGIYLCKEDALAFRLKFET